jgi:hypothetical protein
VTVGDVQKAFTSKGQFFQTELHAVAGSGLSLWPVHHDVDKHVLVRFTTLDQSGVSALDVWVFDTPESAQDALDRTARIGSGNEDVVLHQANVVAVTENGRRPHVEAAFEELLHPEKIKDLPPPPAGND